MWQCHAPFFPEVRIVPPQQCIIVLHHGLKITLLPYATPSSILELEHRRCPTSSGATSSRSKERPPSSVTAASLLNQYSVPRVADVACTYLRSHKGLVRRFRRFRRAKIPREWGRPQAIALSYCMKLVRIFLRVTVYGIFMDQPCIPSIVRDIAHESQASA